MQGKIILFLSILLVPILLVQIYVYYHMFQNLREQELQANLEIARATAKGFDAFVRDVLRQEMIIGLAMTAAGPVSEEDRRRILGSSQAEYPCIWTLAWVNPQGLVVASSDEEATGKDISDRPYFQQILAGRDWIVSDLIVSKTKMEPTFTINRAVRNERGQLLGMVLAGVSPEKLSGMLGIERAPGGGIVLVDSRGMLVYRHPSLDVSWEERDWLSLYPVFREALGGKEVVAAVSQDFEGKPRLIGLAPVSPLGWAAGAGRAEDVAMAAITFALLPQAILVMLGTLAAFAAALILSRPLTISIKRLRDHALALGMGKLESRAAAVSGPVEIRELASAFNSMAAEIRKREAERNRSLVRLHSLLKVSEDILRETTVKGLLQKVADASRVLTGAELGAVGHGCEGDFFRTGAVSRPEGTPACRFEDVFATRYRGLAAEVLEKNRAVTLRLSEGQPAPKELLGVPLPGSDGEPNGLVAVVNGGRGSLAPEDEAVLYQLAALASLGLRHIEARESADRRASEIEAVMDAVPSIIWIAHDPECLRMTGNQVASDTLRVPKSANVSLTAPQPERPTHFKVLRGGVEIPPRQLPVQMAAGGTEIRDYEMELRFEDGESRHLFGNAIPLTNRRGEIYGSLAAFADITELKRIERENLRQRKLLEGMNAVLVQTIVNRTEDELANTCLTVAREIARSEFGFIGETGEDGSLRVLASSGPGCAGVAMPPRDGTAGAKDLEIRCFCEQVAREGKPRIANDLAGAGCAGLPEGHPGVQSFLCVPLKDGDRTFGVIALANRKPGYGQPDREALEALATALAQGLARKRAEESLLKAHGELESLVAARTRELVEANSTLEKQARLLDLAHDAIIVRDMESRILYWNRGAEELYAFAGEEVLGKDIHALLRTRCAESRETVDRCLVERGRWEGELRHRRREGARIEVESRQVLLRDAGSRPVSVLEINRDITFRKRAEEAVRSHLHSLERMNAELQEFAFVASHDLQEPLRKIQAFGDRLRKTQAHRLDETGKDYLARMENAAGRMQRLIQDLLKYSRIAAKPEPFREVDLNDLAAETVQVFEFTLRERDGSVAISELPTIQADPTQMKQLLQNLIGNALKFQKPGGKPRVRISSVALDDDSFLIRVEDNGIGFDKKYVDRIFSPFQRLHGRNEYEGTGMGLAICRKIVERHGGAITAKSSPGKGATFLVTLPARQKRQ